MLDSREFRAGFAQLGELGLTFDAWLLFHQIPRLTALARAFPDTPIVLNHCGGVLGTGRFAGKRESEVFGAWMAAVRELATCPNVMVKLSGLGMGLSGFHFEQADRPPSSEMLADAWRPWMETCLDAFGAQRCMYGSNFPVDKGSYAYGVGLNALKRLMSGASCDERSEVFWRSAARFYRLPDALFA
ncbi:putative TIM-barrel fold metal-dependent hydrolase [Paraburkholderia sp. MM5384-R2]|nr:putative TIM-barrel fold metal-dependent hydrolase [Paraburkholderia sp. MM5384-R2]